MAEPTGLISNKSPYVNRDLNTIFAPIEQVDYGLFIYTNFIGDPQPATDPQPIGEGWCIFTGINSQGSSGNVSTEDFNGFRIQNPGNYRLSMSLIFAGPGSVTRETFQPMVFILNSLKTPIQGDSYVFTPYPPLSNIFSISGLSVAGTGTVTNRNNEINGSNQLNTNTTGEPYFFSFELVNTNTNIATFEITFNVPEVTSTGPTIFPQIRCRAGSANPQTTLTGGRWLFSKLN